MSDLPEVKPVNQASFFAALAVHINAHQPLAELHSAGSDGMLALFSNKLNEAVIWGRTLGGELTVTLTPHGGGTVGVSIHGAICGHPVHVFTADHTNGLDGWLPEDVGQPRHERCHTVTFAELESYVDGLPDTTPEGK